MISKIDVVSRGRVRRSRLFYLRERSGKAARIKDRIERTEREEG
jgi:large subunit ribosomal protein L19